MQNNEKKIQPTDKEQTSKTATLLIMAGSMSKGYWPSTGFYTYELSLPKKAYEGYVYLPFEDFKMAENVCSVALIFIMFYGGFNTKWQAAKSVAGKAIILSSCFNAF